MRATEREVMSGTDFVTALQEQKRRVLDALLEEKTLDAAPILQDDEILTSEEYVTLVYEHHHVYLPELAADGLIRFDRQEDEVIRGTRFEEIR